jgi:hypothetical protein
MTARVALEDQSELTKFIVELVDTEATAHAADSVRVDVMASIQYPVARTTVLLLGLWPPHAHHLYEIGTARTRWRVRPIGRTIFYLHLIFLFDLHRSHRSLTSPQSSSPSIVDVAS